MQTSNDLILGIDLQEDYTQLTYYHASVKEPVTLGLAPGRGKLPGALYVDGNRKWGFWDKEQTAAAGEVQVIDHIYAKVDRQEKITAAGREWSAEELLEQYLRQCIELVRMFRKEGSSLYVMVTVPALTGVWSGCIVSALEKIGLPRKNIYMQDHLTSFYYYAVNQKKNTWTQDAALIEYEKGEIRGYILHIDSASRPRLATVEKVSAQKLTEEMREGRPQDAWDKEKDRLFFEFLKRVFEHRNVSVSYLTGDFFSKEWAERSIQYLCYKRQAFQGQNLYSKGACYAAIERTGLIPDRGILFCGNDVVRSNLGMEVRIRGKKQYYPLVNAGINWYEAYHVCELIPDGTSNLCLVSKPVGEGEPVTHLLRLDGLKNRPNRTLRLRLTIYFTGAGCCRIEAEDLGFGQIVPSSGKTWVRNIQIA